MRTMRAVLAATILLGLSAIAYAEVCPSAGTVKLVEIYVRSNPLVSGQNGVAIAVWRNTGTQTASVTAQIDVLDGNGQVILEGVYRSSGPFGLPAGASGVSLVPFATAGAPAFDGYIQATVRNFSNCSDSQVQRLVILPPCPCPIALPAPIPASLFP
jgi:hypothetical protein